MHAHKLTRAQVVALLEENDTLREALRQMQDSMAPQAVLPRGWRLTPHETTLLLALRRASPGILTKEQCIISIYGVIDHNIPDPKIIDVFICKIRRRLMEAQSGIDIETIWGRGYRLTPTSKQRLNNAIEAEESVGRWESGSPLMVAAE